MVAVVVASCTAVRIQVPLVPTSEDRVYAAKILGSDLPDAAHPRTFKEEIALIRHVQRAVQRIAPVDEGLPLNSPRELKDLYLARRGLCYDRSRSIEKILRLYGFKARHVYILSTAETGSVMKALFQRGNPSHAVSEVLTAEGWLLVDSNLPWIGLTAANEVVSTAALRKHGLQGYEWHSEYAARPSHIFKTPFFMVIGLYSRHGRFYPPYNMLPDVSWLELIENLGD